MKQRSRSTLALVLLAAVAAAAEGQNANPDISVIGDARAWVTDDPGDPNKGEFQIDLESVELALQGYLNPFVRADVYVGYHDGSFELEEAYATILRGLPGGLQIRTGKYRVDFGKLNLLHPHAYSFLDTPMAHQQYLGPEGLVDIGVNFNWQVPLGTAALTLSANLLKGDFAKPDDHVESDTGHAHGPILPELRSMLVGDEEAESEDDPETDTGYSERLSLYVPTGDYSGFEVGLNALQGTLDRGTGRKVALVGADVKYRWTPNKYQSLTVQAEWLRSKRDIIHDEPMVLTAMQEDHEIETVTADGFFAFADLRFRQRWNLGAIVERIELPEEANVSASRVGVFGGFQVMEETTVLRLLLRRSDGDEFAEAANEAVLQLVFSLGPHRAHWF